MFNKQRRREAKLEREVTEIWREVKNRPLPKTLRIDVLKVQRKREYW